jgi:hypothetical protein
MAAMFKVYVDLQLFRTAEMHVTLQVDNIDVASQMNCRNEKVTCRFIVVCNIVAHVFKQRERQAGHGGCLRTENASQRDVLMTTIIQGFSHCENTAAHEVCLRQPARG